MTVTQSWRETLAGYFDDFETPIGRGLNLTIAGLILLSCGLFVAQTYSLTPTLRQGIEWVDRGLFAVFITEYLLRLWAAPDRTQQALRKSSLIDLAVLLPFIVDLGTIVTGTDPLIVSSNTLGFLRIFRWLRVLRLIRFFEQNQQQPDNAANRSNGAIVLRILFTIFAIIFVYSGLIYQVEHRVNEQFTTFLDAVYYAVSSISTAGFGDIAPSTQLGRLLSVLMMVTGVVLIPWQLSDLFRQRSVTVENAVVCDRCGLSEHDSDARFCKRCGKGLMESG